MEDLTKKEKRRLVKEEKKRERSRQEFTSKLRKTILWALVLAILGGGGYWLYRGATRPLPGQEVVDLGRKHVSDGTEVEYNSNPPTSGPHYTEWTRAGIYDKLVSDGHLIHSLEHGYVIISYNCLVPVASRWSPVTNIYAHEEEITESTEEATESTELEDSGWESQECKNSLAKLTGIYEKKGKRKLIVIPRPNLDTRIALTAWTRIDKFDDFDEDRIVIFIDALRNRGPEQTAE